MSKVGTIKELFEAMKDWPDSKVHSYLKDATNTLGTANNYNTYPFISDYPAAVAPTLHKYKGAYSYPINTRLRGEAAKAFGVIDEDGADINVDPLIENLDSVFGRYPLRHDFPLFRGVRYDKDTQLYDQFNDLGFGSWTIDPEVAATFAGGRPDRPGIIMMMDAKKDDPALPLRMKSHDREREILYPRGMRYELLDEPIEVDDKHQLFVPVKPRWGDGGKVGPLKRMLEWLQEERPHSAGMIDSELREGEFGENTGAYMDLLKNHDYDPLMGYQDFYDLDQLSSTGGPDVANRARRLFGKDYMLMRPNDDLLLSRALNGLHKDADVLFPIGREIPLPHHQPASYDEDESREWFEMGLPQKYAMLSILNPRGEPLLPLPISGQSELILPEDSILIPRRIKEGYHYNQETEDWDIPQIEVERIPRKK